MRAFSLDLEAVQACVWQVVSYLGNKSQREGTRLQFTGGSTPSKSRRLWINLKHSEVCEAANMAFFSAYKAAMVGQVLAKRCNTPCSFCEGVYLN